MRDRWTGSLAVTTLAVVACSRVEARKDEAIASAQPSAVVAPHPCTVWKIPARTHYVERYVREGKPPDDLEGEEVLRVEPAGTDRRLFVESGWTHQGRFLWRTRSESLLGPTGYRTLSVESEPPGSLPALTSTDPPLVHVPAEIREGVSWQQVRVGAPAREAVVHEGSPFCRDGFHVTVKVGLSGTFWTDHYCPDIGWRGREQFDVSDEGEKLWTYTLGYVADGVALPDPPLEKRFRDNPPPGVRP